jgi:hypothetical protein
MVKADLPLVYAISSDEIVCAAAMPNSRQIKAAIHNDLPYRGTGIDREFRCVKSSTHGSNPYQSK